MTGNRRAGLVALVVLIATLATTSACKRLSSAAAEKTQNATPVVGADSEGILLTWIDDKGDFHVETRVADVPLMGRDTVRVESNKDDSPTDDQIFIVDLRQTEGGGTYPVRQMSRAAFEAIAVARREKTGPTLASAALPPPAAVPTRSDDASGSHTRPMVVIYGAEWCSACHDAARYLRHRGIAYVEKDIEKDAAAAREMRDKLAKQGLAAGSIPVIDVRGKLMVGFNPGEIDAAIAQAM